ncbi:hypothetical protein CYY_005575 [Polysphondylium violaceum]|uniref:F-box domain-containing protein n=1 Tax=Polysphondylium violaceum TaxID=133409 RepID=A0A8J4Q2T3_9MYCE|nr:hypothetical protein CYY_005575 [Polysphondylium violaceum]
MDNQVIIEIPINNNSTTTSTSNTPRDTNNSNSNNSNNTLDNDDKVIVDIPKENELKILESNCCSSSGLDHDINGGGINININTPMISEYTTTTTIINSPSSYIDDNQQNQFKNHNQHNSSNNNDDDDDEEFLKQQELIVAQTPNQILKPPKLSCTVLWKRFNKFKKSQSKNIVLSDPVCAIDWLPNELLLCIFSYIDPTSLGSITQVNKRYNKLTFDVTLWKIVLRNWQRQTMKKMMELSGKNNKSKRKRTILREGTSDNIASIMIDDLFQNSITSPSNSSRGPVLNTTTGVTTLNLNSNTMVSVRGTSNEHHYYIPSCHDHQLKQQPSKSTIIHTRSFYIETFIRFRSLQRERMDVIRRQEEESIRQKKISNSIFLMKSTCLSKFHEWLCLLSLLCFTILTMLKLDTTITWNWSIIFIPLFYIIYNFTVGPIFYELFQQSYKYNYRVELIEDRSSSFMFSLSFIYPLCIEKKANYGNIGARTRNIQTNPNINRFRVFTPIFSIALFIIFLAIKLSYPSSYSWALVMTPMFLFSIYLIILSLSFPKRIDYSFQWLDQLAIAICFFFLFLFLVFVTLNLTNVTNINWIIVFIPLFIIKLIMFLYPLVIYLLYCLQKHAYLAHKTKWFRGTSNFTLTMICLFIIMGPLLIFEILLCQNLANVAHYSYALFRIVTHSQQHHS